MKHYLTVSSILLIVVMTGMVTQQLLLCVTIAALVSVCWHFTAIVAWLRQQPIVTERSRQQQQPANGNAPAVNPLSKFQEFGSALPDAVIVLTEHGEIEWANKKAADYIGLNYPQDVGLRVRNLLRQPELIAYLTKARTEVAPGLQITSPVNNNIMLEIRAVPLGSQQQLLIVRDVTLILQIQQMRKDFIANASHELRTPVTVIAGYVESFIDDEDCPKKWRDYLQQIQAQTLRIQHLIEDLMQLAILETNLEHIDKEVVQVPEQLLSIIAEAKSSRYFQRHEFHCDIEHDLYLTANQQDTYSIFANLIFNALQHTPAGGRIEIRWYQDSSGAHCSIKDNGRGVAAWHIPRLTERFYRVDTSVRKGTGTGLGLAIVKHALAKHDGKLAIESELNKGSLFRCDFPKAIIVYADDSCGD